MNTLSGCLLINKNIGNTSRDEVNIVSKRLHEKKCGHIGTLDPFASGLLIVLVGRATKIAPFLEKKDKTYIAKLELGKLTDTGDKEGNIVEEKEIPNLDKDTIKEVLNSFLGESYQLPPMYSAVRKNGKHLYEYARKGEEIEREPRKINVFDIRLLSFEKDNIVFLAKVSKGTYIRNLGEDIAKKLNTVGYLSSLERLAIGNYFLKDAVKAEDVTEKNLISIEDMLKDFPSVYLDDNLSKKALNGVPLLINSNNEEILVKDKDGIIAIYKKHHDNVYTCLRGLR